MRDFFECMRRISGAYRRAYIVENANTYDIGWLPIRKLKAYPEDKKRHHKGTSTTVVHCTGVRGGFGVSKKRVEHWRRNPPTNHPNLEPERIALFERFRDTPYHTIVTQAGDILFNRPLWQWSWHAGNGNYGLGFAIDCHPDDAPRADLVEHGRMGLACHFARIGAFSPGMSRFPTVPHRVFSKNRANDPGDWVWREIVVPTCKSWSRDARNFMPDYDLCKGGLPIPREWDPMALFDKRGRRL